MAKNNIEEQPRDSTHETEGASENSGTTESLSLEDLHEELAQVQAQCAEYLDKYRRSAAAFDNYRKRQARDQERQAQQLTADVVRELLPIADDLQRAVEHLPCSGAEADWAKGVILIEQKLRKLLHSYGVVEIEAEGVPFDPTIHESLLTEASDTHPEGTVIEVLEAGYKLGNLVIRPAKVKVSSGSDAEHTTDAT